MRYSTTVPNDPDTHDDFKPTNKLENSSLSLRDVVEQVCMLLRKNWQHLSRKHIRNYVRSPYSFLIRENFLIKWNTQKGQKVEKLYV